MKEKIKKLLESEIKEDQLIGLHLLLNNIDTDPSYIPFNGDLTQIASMKNQTGIEGYIFLKDSVLLLGYQSIRRLNSVADLPGRYKELDTNLNNKNKQV